MTYAQMRRESKKRKAEQLRPWMKYRGVINLDFTHPNENEYQKFVAALLETGWVYLETSAFLIEADLPAVLQSLEIVAKQCHDAGVLSAMTIHIQGSRKFEGTEYRGAKNHPNALTDVRRKPFPKPQPLPPQTSNQAN